MFRSKVTGTDAELSFLGIPALTFNSPVKIGDTIHVNFTVKELIEDEHQRDRGVVLFQCETLNQNDVSTLTSTFKCLMVKRPKA
jgi:acyl dehydratase